MAGFFSSVAGGGAGDERRLPAAAARPDRERRASRWWLAPFDTPRNRSGAWRRRRLSEHDRIGARSPVRYRPDATFRLEPSTPDSAPPGHGSKAQARHRTDTGAPSTDPPMHRHAQRMLRCVDFDGRRPSYGWRHAACRITGT
ncbi:hypothetical protein WI41_19160 [Burkholderia latens]|uniref:Uncharacterized protein n=1 Tax=Burkholderia latens TaxID=488446 RepID=A0AAP1C4N2_9BURK|nr:hypothetical protein WI41_19160 [Burkholderia latens]